MDPAKKDRAFTVACDIVTLNYLKAHGFAGLALDFQKSRCISSKVATLFASLTFERMTDFIRKKSSTPTLNPPDEKMVDKSRYQSTKAGTNHGYHSLLVNEENSLFS
jgi:hypothetical protein